MIAAKVWHWWLSVFLVAGGVLLVISMIVGYLQSVTKDRYPRRVARRE